VSSQETGKPAAAKPRRRVTLTGVLGELLVTAGVLVLLFVGWQNVFNTWVLSGQQNKAAAQLGRQWLEQGGGSEPAPTQAAGGATSAPPLTAVPVENSPAHANAFAVVYVPRFGSDWKRTIREGITRDVLDSYDAGVGHYPSTPMPGAVGNFAVAAHDTGYGNTFVHIQNLQVGDRIYVQTKDGFYTYVFRNYIYVQPQAVQVLLPVPLKPDAKAADRILTMTTCNPPYHTKERLIAYAVMESFSKTVPAAITAQVG